MKEGKNAEYKNSIENLGNFIMIKWANDTTIVPKVKFVKHQSTPFFLLIGQLSDGR